jgi:hypothetical protein
MIVTAKVLQKLQRLVAGHSCFRSLHNFPEERTFSGGRANTADRGHRATDRLLLGRPGY